MLNFVLENEVYFVFWYSGLVNESVHLCTMKTLI